MAMEGGIVEFKCIKEGSKLRIRIVTPGYNSGANTQFPRNIRSEGAIYTAPSSAVRFGCGPNGKFFYRVSAKFVTKLEDEKAKISISKIYEEEDKDCIVCCDKPHDVVIAPCGNFALCSDCANTIKNNRGNCPMCRGNIEHIVTLDQIQT
jgi:hypothetical protein